MYLGVSPEEEMEIKFQKYKPIVYTRTTALLFILLMPKNTSPTTATPANGSAQPWLFPSHTMMAASYECHEELPRWLRSGVDTRPLRLCIVGFSFGPAKTLRSARLGWRTWIVLPKAQPELVRGLFVY
jgi:hypothetical protein